jgi:hypothetical protein
MLRYDFVSNSSSSSYIVTLNKEIYLKSIQKELKYKEFLPFIEEVYTNYIMKGNHPLFRKFRQYLKDNNDIYKDDYVIFINEICNISNSKILYYILNKLGMKDCDTEFTYVDNDNNKITEKKTHKELTSKLYPFISEKHRELCNHILQEHQISNIMIHNTNFDPDTSGLLNNFLLSLPQNEAVDFIENCLMYVYGHCDSESPRPELGILFKYNGC